MEVSIARFQSALAKATAELLDSRERSGHWAGHLSSSALSTATAVTALTIAQKNLKSGDSHPLSTPDFSAQISSGLKWLAKYVNADGGWGDTTKSLSNLSTTTLCWAAFGAAQADDNFPATLHGAECWLRAHVSGNTTTTAIERRAMDHNGFLSALTSAILKRYETDRTFSVPILTMCALSGRLGSGAGAWASIIPLPFELAALPRGSFGWIGLPVVSYALPALIAIGYARHVHAPSNNSFTRTLRNLTAARTLKLLERIQPASGGFLEATPLTSFVVMSLAGSGQQENSTTNKGLEFLLKSQRADGSWPIDSNLATWLTTLSVNALDAPAAKSRLREEDRNTISQWLLQQQFRSVHSYTNAAPGGWAWTDLPGGVPDADDTAGAVLALCQLAANGTRARKAAALGGDWLLHLQNRDGGIPTFCRGWGKLPFDRSSPDLTAHAIRAWLACLQEFPEKRREIMLGLENAQTFLQREQRPEGAWAPLWFGNESAPGEENLTYGTSRVLLALTDMADYGGEVAAMVDLAGPTVAGDAFAAIPGVKLSSPIEEMIICGVNWLVEAQRPDGGWSGFNGGLSSVEETAWAVEALAAVIGSDAAGKVTSAETRNVLLRGVNWLIDRVEVGRHKEAAAVGFYFARLWYFEELYPKIFTVAALNRAAPVL